MGAQTPTPEGQGFLINAKRIRVSRALRGSRTADPMEMRSRLRSRRRERSGDGEVTRPRADGMARLRG